MAGTQESPNVAALRRFSRFYTRQLGLLDEQLLGSGLSLTEVRVLYELVHQPGLAAADLSRRLAIDAGYLSRILRRFVAQGLVRRGAHASDARSSTLAATAKGQKALAPLERGASAQAAALISHLDAGSADELLAAMRTVERSLTPNLRGAPEPVVLRPHQVGDIGWIAHRHGLLYAQEHGYDESFEALVAEIAARFVRDFDPKHERCWVAEQSGRIAGAVFVVRKLARVAQLRLLYVEPSARGQGLGARLVDECIRFARVKGYKSLMLWTQSHLDAARRIYASRGFVFQKEERHRSFGKSLVGQTWTLVL